MVKTGSIKDNGWVLMEEPSTEILANWLKNGYCLATDGCEVTLSGICKHNCRSWFLIKKERMRGGKK